MVLNPSASYSVTLPSKQTCSCSPGSLFVHVSVRAVPVGGSACQCFCHLFREIDQISKNDCARFHFAYNKNQDSCRNILNSILPESALINMGRLNGQMIVTTFRALAEDMRNLNVEGGAGVQIEVKIDPSCTEPKVIIVADSMSEEIQSLVKRLSADIPQVISGIRDERLEVLKEDELIRVYAGSGKVFAVTEQGEYVLRLRLYELEERLDRQKFVRISNSEIVNLKKVKSFDLSFAGTVCVELLNGTVTYVSRRYVPKIKKILGI